MIRHYQRLKLHIQYSILKKQNHLKIEKKKIFIIPLNRSSPAAKASCTGIMDRNP